MDNQKIILVVCDQQPEMDVIVDLLSPDYQLVAVKSGEQALTAVRADTPPGPDTTGIYED